LLGAGSWPQLPFSGPPETIQGRVAGVTGDVMRMGTQGVRLADVEFPDREQTCTRPGKKPLTWRCGDVAYAAFARLVGNRTLSCEVRSRDSQGNALALCREGATVVNEELVRNGHVFAVPGLLSRYSTLEADAQARKVGVWSGEAVRPDKWRQRKWDEAQKRNPDRCPIKGKIIGNAKTYVLPWSPNYDGLKVNPKLGERWFCSEQEAIDAGWKTAGR
jgi:endonuclease YncB( thermonuclease family)